MPVDKEFNENVIGRTARGYEMSEEDLKELKETCKPRLYPDVFVSFPFFTPKEAFLPWKKLGEELGFNYWTIRPTHLGDRFFTAQPSVISKKGGNNGPQNVGR